MIAVALLVAMSCVALVLDQLWINAAQIELTTSAETAALAAARVLAGDHLLSGALDDDAVLARARERAQYIAGQNRAAGTPVELNADANRDIRFGRLVVHQYSGRTRFVATDRSPNTVAVIAHKTRSRNNPVALFLRGLTHVGAADVIRTAQATLDNRLIGLRPFSGSPVPALPIAILKSHSDAARTDTWDTQIEGRAGQDQFTFDAETGLVHGGADGIPEIILTAATRRDRSIQSNVRLVDLGTELRIGGLMRQIAFGWNTDDLASYGGQLSIHSNAMVSDSSDTFPESIRDRLASMTGQCRICLLYTERERTGGGDQSGASDIVVAGVAAGRVMSVRAQPNDTCEIVFQPGVLTTRTAVVFDRGSNSGNDEPARNRYVYNMRLTR